jgi:hypothetical protein
VTGGSHMRYVLLACLIALGLAFDLGLLLATANDPLEDVALHDSAAPVTAPDISFRAIRIAAREFVRDLFDGFAAPYREVLRRQLPPEPLP